MGFVVCVQSYKKDSPSSGLFRVKVYNEHGMAQRNGTGMFPREVVQKPPHQRWQRLLHDLSGEHARAVASGHAMLACD